MFTYDSFQYIDIFGYSISAFRLFVALAIATGTVVFLLDVRRKNLNLEAAPYIVSVIFLCAFFLSHIFYLFIYHQNFFQNPSWSRFFAVFDGMSSLGGFLGGFLGLVFVLKIKKLPFGQFMDSAAFALASGWIFARLACTFAHDHPGKLTHFFLAVQYPDGLRHDLGLYEFFYTILIWVVLFIFTLWKKTKPGTIVVTLVCLYMPVRFCLDFLRVQDRLYFGFTPAQYCAAAILSVLLVTLYLNRRKKEYSNQELSYL